MTGMKRLIGLPVILDGRIAGSVMRGVVNEDGRNLAGVVFRGGLRGARWLPATQIELLGRMSVIAHGKPARLPRKAAYRLFRVSDHDGTRLGIVTDVLLNEENLCVQALEVSAGPMDDLIDGRFFATAFDVRSQDGETGHVTLTTVKEG